MWRLAYLSELKESCWDIMESCRAFSNLARVAFSPEGLGRKSLPDQQACQSSGEGSASAAYCAKHIVSPYLVLFVQVSIHIEGVRSAGELFRPDSLTAPRLVDLIAFGSNDDSEDRAPRQRARLALPALAHVGATVGQLAGLDARGSPTKRPLSTCTVTSRPPSCLHASKLICHYILIFCLWE